MKRLFPLLICVVVSTAAFAQETNCTNGLDDDNDGFIDCYDPDCALNTACDDIFIGNDATCTLEPPPAPAFTMDLDFSSPNETTNHFARMAIGDLDRDGVPEIVTMNKYTKKLFILNGNGGSIKYETVMANNAEPEWEVAIANINDDNCAEIFFLTSSFLLGSDDDNPTLGTPNTERSRIYVYDCQLNFLYSTPQMPGGNNDPINFGIADFGGDGRSEIYCKDEIFNAHTGARLRATTNANWGSQLNGGPVAVDMDNNGDLELVVGLTIFDVNPTATTLTVLNSRAEYFVRNDYNATSVADFNQDGFMDVIASGSAGCHFNNTTIFFWDVRNNVLRTYSDQSGVNGDDYEDGWKNGTGRVNIADLDGDGQLNLSYVSGKYLYALKEDMTLLWKKIVKEETSGYTGCTLFDFNGDGKSEIVYRDEQSLYIIDGTDGSTFNSQPCISRTNREYPIVADVDADGSTEICVTCGFNDATAQANFNNTLFSRYSHVRVFKSQSEPWVPARRVWNQHGYFVVNVNDDLSIPIQQQLHSKEFSTTSCRPGDPVGPIRPLNKFLNQSPFIDTNGCPAYLAPDLAYATAINFIPPTCPGLDFRIQFTITNLGEVGISGSIPVSFYDGNPLKSGANKITTRTFNISDLQTNELFVVDELITSNGTDSLFVALNDAGTQTPPISFPNTTFLECNYDNVRGIAISPLPVTITALQVTPNELCAVPPTGSARAFISMGAGVENTSDYDFYWFDGTTVGSLASADNDGPIYSGIVDGTYTVFAIHKTANCSSDTAQVVIAPAPGILPTVNVTLVSNQTDCDPANGSLQASVTGGNTGYTFQWEDIGAPIPGATGAQLVGQRSGTYTVIVRHTASGCETSADGTIGDLTQEPDVVASATPVTSCANPLSGTLTAEAFKGINPQPDANYIFEWYFYDPGTGRGGLIPPIHGALGTPDRTGLPIGFYEVTITEIATGCIGNPTGIVQVTDQRVTPVVSIAQLTPQTSCDPANPNGRLQASVRINGVLQPTSDWTFEWFDEQNTLPINAHTTVSGVNGSIAEKVKGGGQAYRVRATNAGQCFDIEDEVVTETINHPVVTLTPTPNGICNPALATSAFTGTLTASVTFGGSPVALPNPNYSFTWYNGTQVVGAPRSETTNGLTQLDSGYYTVVVNRTDLGCAAGPETEFVNNTTVLPVILTDTDSSTNCTPLLPGVIANGLGRVRRVDGLNPNTATHSFLWHDGINTSSPIAGATSSSLGSLQGGAGEFYTVLVTNRSNGCQNTATVEIPDAQEKPVITLLPSDNSVCDPAIAGTTRNGSVLIQTVTYKGAPFVGARTNQWFNGVGTGSPNTSTTAATLPNLAAGFYSATVTLTITGCVSDFVPAEVEDDFEPIDILTTPDPSTNCPGGTPNGDIAAAVDVAGVPTTTGFSFRWFTGIAITDPAVPNLPNGGNTAHATQLQGGQDFTVEVTSLSSGCKNTETLILDDDSEIPVIAPLVFSPNLNCTAPFNGTAGVAISPTPGAPFTYRGATITAPYTGFNLVWSGGTVNAAKDGISGLAPGTYTLTVTASTDNCISNPAPATILDDFTYPAINITETNQTSCDNSLPNGQLQAVETSGSGTYSFDWYTGSVVGAPGTELAEISDGLTTAVLVGGNPGTDYTIRVRNASTRCETIQTTVLTDDISFPSLLLLSPTAVTDCANPNGAIDATPTVTSTANNDFTIFYVKQNTTDPDAVKTDPDPTRFQTSIAAQIDRTNLGPGFYASLVRDEITHCESQVMTVQVQDLTDPADITLVGVTNATFCGDNTGGINVSVTGGTPAYTFAWHVGGPTNMGPYDFINDENGTFTPTFNTDIAPFPVAAEDLTLVTNGLYTLVVLDARGCGAVFSESVPFINEPTITVSHVNSTQCDLTNGDGSITTNLNGVNNYTVRLYRGLNLATATLIDTDGPFFGPSLPAVVTTTALDPGDYLIEIMDNTISCAVYKTQTVGVDARDPVITLGTITANTSCIPGTNGDGAVQITIAKDPLDPRPAATPLVFEITAVAPAPLVGTFPTTVSSGLASTSTTINGLGPQEYQITVTELSSGCSIDRFVTVPDQPAMPSLGQTDVAIINDSFCAPNSNGSAEVTSITPVAIANYEFSWYASLASPPVFQNNGAAGAVFSRATAGAAYVLGAPGQGTGTQTFFVRGERLPGTGVGAGCPTPAVQVVIQDEHVTPVLTLTSTPDTSCDPSIGEGSISVRTVTTSPAPPVQNALYTYSINPDPNTVGLLPNSNGALSTPFVQLPDATYTVTALNQISGCPVSGVRTILPGIFNIIITDAVHNDKLVCLPDGDITAQEITIDRTLMSLPDQVFTIPGPPTIAGNFEFRWFKNTPGSFTSGTPLADGSATVINTPSLVIGNGAGQFNDPAPTLGAGTYYVVARQMTGPGRFGANCESVPTRVEILDVSEDPVAALDPTTDTSCDGPFEGSISVQVTDPMAPGAPGYNYNWTALTAGRTPPGPVTNPYNGNNNLFSLVEDGVYQLVVTNNLTGCQSLATQTTVSKTAVPIVVASATNTNQLVCNPDGSITVVDIRVNGVIDANHNNFNFMWYRNAVVAGTELVPFNPPSGNDVLNTVDLPTTMGAGTYFVKAQRVLGLPFGSGCESAPYRVDILDQSVDPDLDFTFEPNSSCNPANPNGTVLATASERDLTTDNYTFAWTYNSGALPGVTTQTDISPTSQLGNAFEGNYVLRTTNTLTGCQYTEGLAVNIDLTISLPNIVTVLTVDPVNCFPTGSARVTQITIGGTNTFSDPPDDINTTFNYQWYRGSIPAGILAGQVNSLLPNQLPDRYFVTVEDLSTNCISSSVEVLIDSADIVYPVIAIQQTSPQASCNPSFGTGSLAATADGQTDANLNYAFTWFPSTDLSGTSFANTSSVTGLFSGGYSVRAFNSLTNCSASALFIVPVDSLEFLPQLALTSGPLTECDSIDGAVFIRGLSFPVTANPSDNYPFAYDYTADLYVGAPPANLAAPEHPNVPTNPNFPGFLQSFVQPNLANGMYTVRLTDNNTGCVTIDTISVKDARVFPNPVITEMAPVTNCDPLRPNGVARALVNGSFNGYRFEWFEGPAATGTVLYTGAQYDELHPTPLQYTVLATHLVTACTGVATTTISNGQVAIPSPDIKIESNVTSCVINNGALSASVGGNVKDFIFTWFDPPPTFVGPYYDKLAVGTYSVTATSRITGCVSPPTSEDIIADPAFPEIEFSVQPATCGQNNGSISLSIVSSVAISSVTWSDASGALIQVGPGLDDVYAGTYRVTVTTILGCESEEEIVIDTEIRPRNFISRNGDNSNSYFHIDCIENFTVANGAAHDNKVKIFNRVGTLVYEMDGYDNVDIYFNGKSNKGVGTNLMGTDLPDGTYFFIVDKKNGERPMEGYLEIVK